MDAEDSVRQIDTVLSLQGTNSELYCIIVVNTEESQSGVVVRMSD